jgi:hypothetical protein
VSLLAGKIRRRGEEAAAAPHEVSSTDSVATMPSASAPVVVDEKKVTVKKFKAKKVKAKKVAAKKTNAVKVNANSTAEAEPVLHAIEAVAGKKTYWEIAAASMLNPIKALKVCALALSKAIDDFYAAMDPVMEVVFTVVPIFDVLAMALKLTSKAYEAVDSALKALDPVMEVVFTVVPIFDVLEMSIVAASKLAVILAATICKAAKFVGKVAAFVFKVVGKVGVAVVMYFLAPFLPVFADVKFFVYTVPRYIVSLVWARVKPAVAQQGFVAI